MKIQLSDHFDYGRLIRFTVPSVVMMIFISIYSVVDGFFISNFVGITPFASVNLIMPVAQMLACFGFMFGAGGSALVSATLGARDHERANRIFSMITYIATGVAVGLAILGAAFIRPISLLLGADEAMLPYCVVYGRILLLGMPAFFLQNLFQSFLVTAQKPTFGLVVTLAAGLTNMVLDALFIVVFKWDIVGAALATVIAQCVGGFIPLAYFLRKNDSPLRLGKFHFDGKALLTTCTNGSSELVANISMSVVSMLYNFQLMRLAGEDGVAAYGAVMYVSFVFVAVFLGYSIGAGPVIGFHYGAQNHEELKGLWRRSNVLVISASAILAGVAMLLAAPMARLFVGQDAALTEMTVYAFRCYALAVLFSGFSIFGSAFFTGLNNGFVSAAISFLRTFVFQVAAVLILPMLFDLEGVWYALFVAEILSVVVTVIFYQKNRKKYHY